MLMQVWIGVFIINGFSIKFEYIKTEEIILTCKEYWKRVEGEKVGEWHNYGVPAKPPNGSGEGGGRIWHKNNHQVLSYSNHVE